MGENSVFFFVLFFLKYQVKSRAYFKPIIELALSNRCLITVSYIRGVNGIIKYS